MFDEQDNQTLSQSERAFQLSFMAMLSAILDAVHIVSIIIMLIFLMILGNTIAMGVRERTNEYGVLRALGFLPKHVALFILAESMTLGVIAGLIGVGLGWPLVELGMGRFLEENVGAFFPFFDVEPVTAVLAFGLAIALSLAAAAVPAYRASKLTVTDALRRVG
jgi:putative ABC transport system permease protein